MSKIKTRTISMNILPQFSRIFPVFRHYLALLGRELGRILFEKLYLAKVDPAKMEGVQKDDSEPELFYISKINKSISAGLSLIH